MSDQLSFFILSGSNLGNSREILTWAAHQVSERLGAVTQRSQFYRSPPWGFDHPNDFINQALELRTSRAPQRVLQELLSLEREAGRERSQETGYQARTLDLDILLAGDLTLHTDALQIPHPRLPERRFALLPLAEIASEVRHPVLRKSVSELLRSCPDPSSVQPWP